MPDVIVQLTRCQKCGTTKKKVEKTVPQEFSGIDSAGQPYTHIIRRWCRCSNKSCNQMRVERSYENLVSTL